MKEKWAAERATPEVRAGQSGSPASCFQHHRVCLMGNPTEKPLTLNKEERRETADTERGWEKKKKQRWREGRRRRVKSSKRVNQEGRR